MALQLPTDTASLRLETKQYELFNKRLGNGIQRRVLTIGVSVAVPWVCLLLLLGVPLFSRFGPQFYILPPFILVYRAIRRDESGRMAVMGWYDKALITWQQRNARYAWLPRLSPESSGETSTRWPGSILGPENLYTQQTSRRHRAAVDPVPRGGRGTGEPGSVRGLREHQEGPVADGCGASRTERSRWGLCLG